MFRNIKQQAGFTLLELMVAMVLAVVLLTAAAPSYKEVIKNNRQETLVNQFVRMLSYARSQAVSLNSNVMMCESNNVTSATPSCRAGEVNAWHDGWLMFVDVNNSNAYEEGTDTLLKTGAGVSDTGHTLRRAVFDGGSPAFAIYRPNGLGDAGGGATFVLCDPRGDKKARAINVSRFGRVSQAIDNDGNGIVNDSRGGDISCT